MDIASGVGEKIKLIREANRMTQNQLSKKSRVSQSQISAIESGSSNVGIATLNDLARGLNVSVNDLISDFSIDYGKYFCDNSDERKKCCQYEFEKMQIFKSFYPQSDFDLKFNTLLEFFVYLPLIDPFELFELCLKIWGDFNGQERYLASRLEYLVRTIPSSPARDYADYVYGVIKERKEKRTPDIMIALDGHEAAHKKYVEGIERKMEFFRCTKL